MPRLSAIVLAAGEGRRMGMPKALLPLAGVPLVERHVRRLLELGCDSIDVVLRPELAAASSVRTAAPGRVFVVAARTATQAESLAAGLRVLASRGAGHDDDAVLVTPVDLVPPALATLVSLVDALAPPALAVTPVHRGRGGHPVVARCHVLADPTGLDGVALPLRARLAALGPRRVRVPVDDPAVLGDFDVPSDLEH